MYVKKFLTFQISHLIYEGAPYDSKSDENVIFNSLKFFGPWESSVTILHASSIKSLLLRSLGILVRTTKYPCKDDWRFLKIPQFLSPEVSLEWKVNPDWNKLLKL